MAKKKQIELTIEEKLQNALVPKEEQPYKIPSNWCWGILGEITSVIGGGTPSSKINEYYDNGDIAWITPSDLSNYNNMYISKGKKMITKLGLMKSSAKLLPKGTVCLSSRAPIGYVVIAKNELSTNQGFKSFLPSKVFKSEYLYWYLKSIKHILEAKASGTTFLELSAKKAGEVEIPLPPLNEQQRIVNRIESLFTKLDRAKELIENALAQFEQNKMAILHKAFTGELTAKWRKENNIDLSSWKEKTIDELCTSLKYGTSKKSKPEGSVVVLRMGNLQNGEIDWSNLMYTDDKDDIEKYLLKKGDVLFNRTNSPELVGKTSIYRGEYPAIYAGYLIKLDYGKDIIGEYLNYMMNSTKAKHYCYTVKTDGVSQSNINAKKIGAFKIPMPTIEEQQEIVNILDKLLAKYNKIKNLEQQLEKIELLKKAILAKAFRGELGTNNPDEESAENLLKEILAEK